MMGPKIDNNAILKECRNQDTGITMFKMLYHFSWLVFRCLTVSFDETIALAIKLDKNFYLTHFPHSFYILLSPS